MILTHYHPTHNTCTTHSCIVYERQPPPQADKASHAKAGGSSSSTTTTHSRGPTGGSTGGGNGGGGGGRGGSGSFSLLYPKRSSLAARVRAQDPLFLDLLSRLLSLHPDARPTAEEALSHPWLIPPPGEGAPSPPPHLALLNATM